MPRRARGARIQEISSSLILDIMSWLQAFDDLKEPAKNLLEEEFFARKPKKTNRRPRKQS